MNSATMKSAALKFRLSAAVLLASTLSAGLLTAAPAHAGMVSTTPEESMVNTAPAPKRS